MLSREWMRQAIGVIYELICASVCHHYHHYVSFEKHHDFIFEQIPAEVKTKFPPIDTHYGEEFYMSDENKEAYEKWLDDSNTLLGEGQGRHDALKFKINSYYYKYKDEWLDLTDAERFQRAWDWNVAHCKPAKPKEEFDSLVKWTIDTHKETRDALHKKIKEERKNKSYTSPKQAERVVKISEKICKELFHDQQKSQHLVLEPLLQ